MPFLSTESVLFWAANTIMVQLVALSFLSLLLPSFTRAFSSDQKLTLSRAYAAANVAPLVNFQVQQPPALPSSGAKCTVELVHHLFANSYYQREIF